MDGCLVLIFFHLFVYLGTCPKPGAGLHFAPAGGGAYPCPQQVSLGKFSLMFFLGSNFILLGNFHTDLRAFCQPSFPDSLQVKSCAKKLY